MEKFRYWGNEQQIIMCNGTYTEDNRKSPIRLLLSNKRIVFLQPVTDKNVLGGIIYFLVTLGICGVIFAVGAVFSSKNGLPAWVMPACLIIAGSTASSFRNFCSNPERCMMFKGFSDSDIQKIECITAFMQYPVFKLFLANGDVVTFESNNNCKAKFHDFFKSRFTVIKQ